MAMAIAPPAGEPLASDVANAAIKHAKDRTTIAGALKKKPQKMPVNPITENTHSIVKAPDLPLWPAHASRDKRISSLRLPIREKSRVPQPQAVDNLFRITNDRSRTIPYREIF